MASPLRELGTQGQSGRKTPKYGGTIGLAKGLPTTAESPLGVNHSFELVSTRRRSARRNVSKMANTVESLPRTPSMALAPAPTYGRSVSTNRKERLANVAMDRASEAQAEWNEKTWVWVEEKDGMFVAAWIVLEGKEGSIQVCTKSEEVKMVGQHQISKMNPPKFDKVDDIADLTFLNEASVIHNIYTRYHSDLIYTYSGLFLVAVNPYKSLPIYNDNVVSSYRNKRRGDRPPHVFAITDAAFSAMMTSRESQSILVTGESGAGKTENTKKVIQYLATVAGDAEKLSSRSDQDINFALSTRSVGQLERQILQANPILEAFGNAQTIRNNNSSRFGKFVRIEFDAIGQIGGANIDWYLLEKSRVVARSDQERNFHIFYQLLSGASTTQRQELLLDGLTLYDFNYLNTSRSSIEGVNDAHEFAQVIRALDVVGFSDDEQRNIFRVVAAILHIGNIGIMEDRSGKAYLSPGPQGFDTIAKVCKLISLDRDEFEKAIFAPKLKAGREWVTQSRNKVQVTNELGALCKALYERLFGALVTKMNESMSRGTKDRGNFIGVLDIAGFEIFKVNSFEQLCINYTNERLQQFFNHHMFVLEQEEYARENISWDYVNFGLDLQPTIELIESNHPIGVLSCLDEESIMPKASDASFTQKLHSLWKGKSDKYPAPKPMNAATNFVIQHYAGAVEYCTDGWLDKNKDPLNDHITRTLAASKSKYVAGLFADYLEISDDSASPKKRRKGAFRTVAQRHREQLTSLMNRLESTQPHFIRCILPNNEKRAGKIDSVLVLDQLKCNGVLEGIRIARLGYPNRLPFSEFRQRYELIAQGAIPKGYIDSREAATKIIKSLELSPLACKLGTSKIFFKAGVLAEIEERRESRLGEIFTKVNAFTRRYLSRRKVKKILERDTAIRLIQRNIRAYNLVKDSPWYQLFAKIRPTLNASRVEEELQKKAETIANLEAAVVAQLATQKATELQRSSLEAEKQAMEAELDAERALIEQKDLVLRRTKEREAALEDEIEKGQKMLHSLQASERQAVAAKCALEEEQLILRSSCDQLASELRQTEAALRECEGRVEDLNFEIKTLKQREHESMLKSIPSEDFDHIKSELANERRKAEQNQRQLQLWGENLQSKLTSAENQRDKLKAELEILQQQQKQKVLEMSNVARMRTDAETMKKSFETQIASLRERLDARDRDLAELESTKRLLINKVAKAEADLAHDREESKRVIEEKRSAVHELLALQKAIEQNASQQDQQKSVVKQLQEEIEIYRTRVATLENERAALHDKETVEADKLAQELQLAKVETQRAIEELQDAQRALDIAQVDMRVIAERVLDAQDETAAVQAEYRRYQAEMETDRDKYSQSEQNRQSTEQRMRDLQNRANSAEETRATIEKELRRTQSKLKVVQINEASFHQKIEALETRSRDLEGQLAFSNQENAKLLRSGERLRQDLADKISALERTPTHVMENISVLEETKRVQDKELLQARSQISDLELANDNSERTLVRVRQELEDSICELKKQKNMSLADDQANRKLSEANQVLQGELVRAKTEYSFLEEKHEKVMKSIKSLSEDLSKSHQEKKDLHDAVVKDLQAKLRSSEESRHKLEKQMLRSQEDKENILADDNVRNRMLEDMHTINATLAREMDEVLRSGAVKATNPLSSALKKNSSPYQKNGAASPSAAEADYDQLRMDYLRMKMTAESNERIKTHLEQQLDMLHKDFASQSASTYSIDDARSRLTKSQAQLRALVEAERARAESFEQAHKADASALSALQRQHTVHKIVGEGELKAARRDAVFQKRLVMESEKEYQSQLAIAQDKASAAERQVQEAEAALARKSAILQDELNLRQQAEGRINDLEIQLDSNLIHLSQERSSHEMYQSRAEEYAKKLEAVEVEKYRIEHAKLSALQDLKEARDHLATIKIDRDRMEKRARDAEQKMRDLEAHFGDQGVNFDEIASSHRQLKAELEDERIGRKTESDRLRGHLESMQHTYQDQMKQLSSELDLERDAVLKLRDEARSLRSNEEDLHLKIEDLGHCYTTEKLEKEREKARHESLHKEFQDLAKQFDDSQTQIQQHAAEKQDLFSRLQGLEDDLSVLQKANRSLERRLEAAQTNGKVKSGDLGKSKLDLEKHELRSRLEQEQDKALLAHEKLRKSEASATELQTELAKEREQIVDLHRQKNLLDKQVKDLHAQLINLKTKPPSAPASPEASKRVNQLWNELEHERSEINRLKAEVRSSKIAQLELNSKVEDIERLRARHAEETNSYEKRMNESKSELSHLRESESQMQIAKRRADREILDLRERATKSERELNLLRTRLERRKSTFNLAQMADSG